MRVTGEESSGDTVVMEQNIVKCSFRPVEARLRLKLRLLIADVSFIHDRTSKSISLHSNVKLAKFPCH
jgi:hypothetical protein